MRSLLSRLPFISTAFLALFLLATAARGHADTTSLLIGSSILMLTRFLCGAATAREIGAGQRAGILPHLLFPTFMLATRAVDTAVRLVIPEFSISRLITRVVGYQFTVKVLMDQTCPLKLPPTLLNRVSTMPRAWHNDPKALRRMNALERRLTGRHQAAAETRANA